jgi:OOP family OmpA-OmpF porin
MTMLRSVVCALWFLVAAGAAAPAQDLAGARDYQGIPRFQGSRIIGHQALPHAEFRLPVGPLEEDDKFQWQMRDALALEGKVTGYVYALPAGITTFEVFRNYEAALEQAGFAPLFKCDSRETCGNESVLVQAVYSGNRIMQNSGIRSAQAVMYGDDLRYLATKRSAGGAETYVSVIVGKEAAMGGADQDTISAVLHVIEPKAMGQSMVFVDAGKMASEIGTTGRVALYGIYFDTGSAEVKAESEPTLAEIAKLMKQDQNRKMFVVGHTDSVGGYEQNMGLSQRRAKAVVDVLTRRHGIPAARLQSAGVGFLSPVASNASEEGKAKNRRVELVQE